MHGALIIRGFKVDNKIYKAILDEEPTPKTGRTTPIKRKQYCWRSNIQRIPKAELRRCPAHGDWEVLIDHDYKTVYLGGSSTTYPCRKHDIIILLEGARSLRIMGQKRSNILEERRPVYGVML